MACDEMVEAVLTSSMANETVEAIWKAAEEIFPAANDIAFAVRSSAIGENKINAFSFFVQFSFYKQNCDEF